jgi:hypothetical protein
LHFFCQFNNNTLNDKYQLYHIQVVLIFLKSIKNAFNLFEHYYVAQCFQRGYWKGIFRKQLEILNSWKFTGVSGLFRELVIKICGEIS